MRRTIKIRWILATVLLIAVPAAQAGVPAVLQQVPVDAQVIIAIPRLAGLSKKLAIVNQKLGLNQLQMNNSLGFAKAMVGLMAGIDDDGGAALVFTALPLPQPAQARPEGQPKAVLLLPVRDYKLFLSNFGPAGSESDGINQIQIMNKPVFARRSGGFAVLGIDRQPVADFRPPPADAAGRFDRFGQQVLSKSDISIVVDLAGVGRAARPAIRRELDQMGRMFKQFGGQLDAQAMRFMDAYLDIYGDVIDAVLRDGDVYLQGIDISGRGVGFTSVFRFKSGSKLATGFARNPVEAPSLNRLPDRPYLFAMTMNTSTLPIRQWAKDIADVFPKESGWDKLFAQTEQLIDASGQDWQTVMYAPEAGAEGPFMKGLYVVTTRNPGDYMRAYRSLMTQLDQLDMNGFGYDVTFQPEARQIAGHPIDQYSIKFRASDQFREQLGQAADAFQDQNGSVFHLDDVVVIATNADERLLAEAIEAAGGTGGTGGTGGLETDPGIASARKRLPKHNVAQFYLNVGSLVKTMSNLNPRAVPAAAVELPGNLPPIGAAVAINQGSIAMRGHVPMSVIRAIKDAATNTMGGGFGPTAVGGR